MCIVFPPLLYILYISFGTFRSAKDKRLRWWKDYAPSGPTIDAKEKEFQGKVVEVINADAMMVKVGDQSPKKIFLASIRPPRCVFVSRLFYLSCNNNNNKKISFNFSILI